jgi:hypothetical protein
VKWQAGAAVKGEQITQRGQRRTEADRGDTRRVMRVKAWTEVFHLMGLKFDWTAKVYAYFALSSKSRENNDWIVKYEKSECVQSAEQNGET